MPQNLYNSLSDNNSVNNAYFGTTNFIKAYADPNLETPLGRGWHFDPCFVTEKYIKYAEALTNFVVRPDDVWSITFPKCGSTWTQEMIFRINNNIHYEKKFKVNTIDSRFPFLEMGIIYDIEEATENFLTLESLNESLSPRHIKTHLPMCLLPKQLWTVKPKIIYTSRNPKDVLVSYFHHYVNIQGYKGDFQDFLRAFVENQVLDAPFHAHILDFWCIRNENNVLFISYEEMKKDLRTVLKKTANFLDKSYNAAEYQELENLLTFKAMSVNNNCNQVNLVTTLRTAFNLGESNFRFMRKGEVGSYSADMSIKEIQQFDDWSAQQITKYRNAHKNCAELEELPIGF